MLEAVVVVYTSKLSFKQKYLEKIFFQAPKQLVQLPAFVHLPIVFFVKTILLYLHLLHPLRHHWKSRALS